MTTAVFYLSVLIKQSSRMISDQSEVKENFQFVEIQFQLVFIDL